MNFKQKVSINGVDHGVSSFEMVTNIIDSDGNIAVQEDQRDLHGIIANPNVKSLSICNKQSPKLKSVDDRFEKTKLFLHGLTSNRFVTEEDLQDLSQSKIEPQKPQE